MSLKLGDAVLWGDKISATLIAFQGPNHLIGWKDADPEVGLYGWVIAHNLGAVRNADKVSNFSEFKYALWVRERDLILVGKLHRLGSKTLQKRMRDQISQRFLMGKS